MKQNTAKFKQWWSTHKPSTRRLIQLYSFLLYNANVKGIISGNIYQGEAKYACVPGLNCYSCPGAVGSCPLGSLQNSLASANKRAPYYVFGILMLFGLLLGRAICGFLCPVGLGQELLYKANTPKLSKSKVTRILSYFKYVILLVFVVAVPLAYAGKSVPVPAFCKYICPAGTLGGAVGLLINPSNASFFDMLGPLFTWKFCVLVVLCVASVFVFRFFCRFICPLGALYGFFNKFALLGVTFDQTKCTDCGLCVSHCKMDIRHVGDHECINCGECIGVCPTQAISWKGSKIMLRANEAAVPTEEPAMQAVASNVVCDGGAAVATAKGFGGAALQSKPKLKNNKPLRLKIIAWSLALAVLLGALVYFNFLDKPSLPEPPPDSPDFGNAVGDRCPLFSVQLLGSDGQFTVEESLGKVTVINFWATWCGPCLHEIPAFEQLYNDYSDKMNLVAINYSDTRAEAEAKIAEMGWSNYNLAFAWDEGDCFVQMGGKGALPVTIVVDTKGVIVYNQAGSLTYAELLSKVQPLFEK